MSSIGGKDDLIGQRIDRAGAGLELAVEKFVEGAVGVDGIGEFGGIEAILLEKGGDFVSRCCLVHAPAIPVREAGAFDEAVQGDFP